MLVTGYCKNFFFDNGVHKLFLLALTEVRMKSVWQSQLEIMH